LKLNPDDENQQKIWVLKSCVYEKEKSWDARLSALDKALAINDKNQLDTWGLRVSALRSNLLKQMRLAAANKGLLTRH
jgi:hypothetical protein